MGECKIFFYRAAPLFFLLAKLTNAFSHDAMLLLFLPEGTIRIIPFFLTFCLI